MGFTALLGAGLLAASLSAVSPRWELSLRSEAHYRQVELSPTVGGRIGELELQPALRLQLEAPDSGLELVYRPRFVLADQSVDRTLIHEGALLLHWPLDTWTMVPSLEGRYGNFNVFQLLATGQQTGQSQALPWVQTILAQSLIAQVTVTGRPAARHRVEGLLAAYLDGGADQEARRTLPLQRGLRARALLEWQATRLGTLTSTLTGTAARFSSGPDVAFAVWEEGWRQRLSREAEVWLAVGGSATQQRRDGVTTVTALPSGQAGAGYHFGIEDHEVRARLAGTLAPEVDRISGDASQRLGVSGAYRLDLGRVWVVDGELHGGQVMRGPQRGDLAWGGILSVGRILGEHLQLDLGVRGYDQRQRQTGIRGYEWVVFTSLTATARGKWTAVGAP